MLHVSFSKGVWSQEFEGYIYVYIYIVRVWKTVTKRRKGKEKEGREEKWWKIEPHAICIESTTLAKTRFIVNLRIPITIHVIGVVTRFFSSPHQDRRNIVELETFFKLIDDEIRFSNFVENLRVRLVPSVHVYLDGRR